MAQSEYQSQLTTVEVYRGMNERTIPANLENGEYTRTKGVSFREGRASRIPGKKLKEVVGDPVLRIYQFGNIVLVQTRYNLLKTTVAAIAE